MADPSVVVGAAIVDEAGRLLAVERAAPPYLAGQWEFPGGKVEPGESDVAALVRECREELGVTVEVGARLGADVLLDGPRGPWVLRVWLARVVAGGVTLTEHSAARWLTADDVYDVPWIAADAPLVEAAQRYLRG